VVVKHLKRMYNLVFFKYKPLSTCLDVPPEIPTSVGGVLMFLTINRGVREKFRQLRDFFKPRSDLEEV
jgi:hypothetical protein